MPGKYTVTFEKTNSDINAPNYGYIEKVVKNFNSFQEAINYVRGLTNVNFLCKPVIEEK